VSASRRRLSSLSSGGRSITLTGQRPPSTGGESRLCRWLEINGTASSNNLSNLSVTGRTSVGSMLVPSRVVAPRAWSGTLPGTTPRRHAWFEGLRSWGGLIEN
jgi:hypothetical protein